MFSFESCCEDDINCACTVKVNCALPNDEEQDAHAKQLAGEILFWTGNRITSPSTRASNTSEWSPDSHCQFQTCPVSFKYFKLPTTQHPSLLTKIQVRHASFVQRFGQRVAHVRVARLLLQAKVQCRRSCSKSILNDIESWVGTSPR